MDKEENRPPGCEHCKKPCTIHLTQIVDNQIVKMDMCEDCPHAQKLQDPEQFGLMDQLLGKVPESTANVGDLRCPSCGFTEADFRKLNRFGCPHCYETFKPIIEKILPQLHRGIIHQGKAPENLQYLLKAQRIEELKKKMQEAVESERFEEAADIRDEIRQLEESGN